MTNFNQLRHLKEHKAIRHYDHDGSIWYDADVLRRELPLIDYDLIEFANQNLPGDAKILSIFLGNRIYYSDKVMVSDVNLLFKALKQSAAPETIGSIVKQSGVTHIIIRSDLFDQWLNDNFDGKEKDRIKTFWQTHLRLLYFKNGYGLFKL